MRAVSHDPKRLFYRLIHLTSACGMRIGPTMKPHDPTKAEMIPIQA
jgi:hypothetical protein